MGQIYGAGAAVGLMGDRSIGQDLLWGRCRSDLWGRICCGSDVWGRRCSGAHVDQIFGAGAALVHM